MNPAALTGLDLLATAVVVVDDNQAVLYMNPAAENLFEASHTSAAGLTIERLLGENAILAAAISYSRANHSSYTEHEIEIATSGRQRLNLACTVSPADLGDDAAAMLLEFRQIDQQLRVEREARLLEQSQAHRELIRNLAHEIKNPLGGIRGAAQLLDRELERPGLHEYTQVIIKESDRLQALMDRLLTPHRLPLPGPVNIHEVLERVRSVMLAEFPDIAVRRDYDTSLPLLTGDREQLRGGGARPQLAALPAGGPSPLRRGARGREHRSLRRDWAAGHHRAALRGAEAGPCRRPETFVLTARCRSVTNSTSTTVSYMTSRWARLWAMRGSVCTRCSSIWLTG
jgi:nitrogen-specific signal transduction histidine kinase